MQHGGVERRASSEVLRSSNDLAGRSGVVGFNLFTGMERIARFFSYLVFFVLGIPNDRNHLDVRFMRSPYFPAVRWKVDQLVPCFFCRQRSNLGRNWLRSLAISGTIHQFISAMTGH